MNRASARHRDSLWRLVAPLGVALFVSALLVACGGSPEAGPLAGGGASEAFAGHLTVFVVDGTSGSGLADVTVRIDDVASVTDGEGRVDVDVASYDTIEVSHDGLTERWHGLTAAVVTVPMGLDSSPPDGTLSGTLDLGGLMPEDTANHLSAVVSASHTPLLDRDAPSAAVSCSSADGCAFSFAVASSNRRVFAEVLELDEAEAVVSVRALFVSPEVLASAGQDTVVELLRVDAPLRLDVAAPTGSMGFDEVVGVPGATLGDDVLLFSARGMGQTRLLPPGSRAVWAVATGRTARGESRSIVRSDSTPESLATSPLTAVPTATLEGERVLLPDAAHRVLRTSTETVRVFDARDSVERPTGGEIELELTAVTVSTSDVSLDAIERDWLHRVRATL